MTFITISQFIGVLISICIIVTVYLEVVVPSMNQRKWKKLKINKDEGEMKEERERIAVSKQDVQQVYSAQQNVLLFRKKLERRLEDLKYNLEAHESPGYKLANLEGEVVGEVDDASSSSKIKDDQKQKIIDEMESTRDSITRLIQEQDVEYEKYKQIDIEKERQKLQKKKEELDRAAKKRERAEWLKDNLKPEPEAGSAHTTNILIRLPSGATLKRRFLATDHIQDILDFIDSEQLLDKEYYLTTNHPKRIYSQTSMTLNEAQLFPSITLYVMEQ